MMMLLNINSNRIDSGLMIGDSFVLLNLIYGN